MFVGVMGIACGGRAVLGTWWVSRRGGLGRAVLLPGRAVFLNVYCYRYGSRLQIYLPAFLLVEWARPMLPYGLGFAAGAMAFMVLDELLPEAYTRGNTATVALLTSVAIIAMVLFQHSL